MPQEKTIYVIGSSNTDIVVRSKKLPVPGETVIGGDYFMNQGGKGANQAVSCARLGGNVRFICRLGNDLFGKQALEGYTQHKIDTKYICIDPQLPTGIALINVDNKGENTITVAPGANNALSVDDIGHAIANIKKDDIVLIQLEIPIETVIASIQQSSEKGARVILNPAPAQELPESLYQHLFLITPNETEAHKLTGIKVNNEETASKAAKAFIQKGCKHVVITLGSKGAFLHTDNFCGIIPAHKVKVLDTTAAGDCFNGALAVAIAENQSLLEAVRFATKAAAISVTRMGAQNSIPLRHEIDDQTLS